MKRIRRLFHLRKLDETLDWEIRHHLDERIDELVAQGLTREQATREAERTFGTLKRWRGEMRQESEARERRMKWHDELDGVRYDVRMALRGMRKHAGLTAIGILVLGLGIGANTAIFTALRAALLQGPPYPQADRLVLLDILLTRPGEAVPDTMAWSYPKFARMRGEIRSVAPVAGFSTATATLTGTGSAARVSIEYVSPSYFELLGVRALRGALFDSSQEPPAPGDVVLLSHALWQSVYGGAAHVVGKSLRLDGAPLRIAGVLPANFRGLSGSADVWVPLAGVATVRGPRRLQQPWAHWLHAVGRLEPGVTLAQAQQEAVTLGAVIDAAFPAPGGSAARQGMNVVPLSAARVNPVARLAITAVSLGAFLLLLIACGNVGSLLLARAAARRSDLAVRAALGAGRRRLVRESLIESMLLAVAGGALGLFLAWSGQRIVSVAVRYALDTEGTRNVQFLDASALSVNGGVLLAGVALALLTGLLFGLLPARAAGRTDVAQQLRAGGRGALRASEATQSGRSLLVTVQLALTVVLLAGATLMATSFARLSGVNIGFTNQNVLVIGFNRGTDTSPEQDRVFEQQLLERLAALPGVRSAAVAPCPPLSQPCEVTGLKRVDDHPKDESEMVPLLTYAVSDDYFSTLGIAVRQGRSFTSADAPNGAPVAVLNEAAARQLFPGQSAIGHRVAVTIGLTERQMATVVGVAGDVQYENLEAPIMGAIYFSSRQAPSSYGTLFLHTSGDPYAVLDAVRREVAALDPELPLYDITTMKQRHVVATARTRVVLGLFGAFALAGLLLSALGLYGLVSFSVVQRTREMGLRMALGANASSVIRLVLRAPIRLAFAGAAAGCVAAWLLTRYARVLLFQVEPSDPRVLGVAAVVLGIVALAAALLPARKATRIEPSEALRAD